MPDNYLIIRQGHPTDGELAALLVVFTLCPQQRTDVEADFDAHGGQSGQPILGRAPWTRSARYTSPASWITGGPQGQRPKQCAPASANS
jgi:hypothetical protein